MSLSRTSFILSLLHKEPSLPPFQTLQVFTKSSSNPFFVQKLISITQIGNISRSVISDSIYSIMNRENFHQITPALFSTLNFHINRKTPSRTFFSDIKISRRSSLSCKCFLRQNGFDFPKYEKSILRMIPLEDELMNTKNSFPAEYQDLFLNLCLTAADPSSLFRMLKQTNSQQIGQSQLTSSNYSISFCYLQSETSSPPRAPHSSKSNFLN